MARHFVLANILLLSLVGLTNIECDVKGGSLSSKSSAESGSPTATSSYVDTSAYAMHVTYNGTTLDTAKALNNLRTVLQETLAPAVRGGIVSTKIVLFEPNNQLHPIYALNPYASVLPASVEKLFTSSSTIWALGSKYAFSTKLDLAPASQVSGGKVVGNVYLRPSGDPTFSSDDFDDIARQLRQQGITTIQGDIISDLGGQDILSDEAKKYFNKSSTQSEVATTSIASKDTVLGEAATEDDSAAAADDEDESSPAGVLSAYPNFAIDRNVVQVTVTGGGSKGAPVSVRVYPPILSFAIHNSGKTSAAATVRTKRVGKGKRARTVRVRGSAVNTLHVTTQGTSDDQQQVINITGQLPANVRRTYSFPIKNVPLAMAGLLKWRLQQNGIQVTGNPRADILNAGGKPVKTIASVQTNLMDLLRQMNKRSDNYLAESMFRKLSTIATVAANSPDERARKLMKSWLEVCNVDGTQCTFIDGSGLSKSNRTTANTVINLLASIRQQGLFPLFTSTLSIAGVDGTLRNRMKGTTAQYNAHGKTGTLNAVTALAGYVTTGDGQLAAYFITMQKFRGGPAPYKRIQDRLVEALADFKYSTYQSGGEAIDTSGSGEILPQQ